ncbi:MAG TPA: YciI family protein [Nitrososphaeraceae archaeon]|nr:YciI family protein [Nitrososphaeraceae archaeon]
MGNNNTEKKNRFLCKLIPPRPSFVQDMTEAERKVMQEHAAYWKTLVDNGTAIVFGLVLDPKGPWGLGIVEVANESDVHMLGTNDPAVKEAGLTFEVYLMPNVVV